MGLRYGDPSRPGQNTWVEAPYLQEQQQGRGQSVYEGLPLAPGVTRMDLENEMLRKRMAAQPQQAAPPPQQTQQPIQRTLPAQTVQQQQNPMADQTPRAMGPARSIAELRVLQQQEAAREKIAKEKEAEEERIAKAEPVRKELADSFVEHKVTDEGGNILAEAAGTVPPPAVVKAIGNEFEQFVPAELKFQKEIRDDEYRKTEAGYGVQGGATQRIRELSSPAVYKEVQRRVAEGTDSMQAKKESIKAAKGALGRLVAEAAGFAPMQAMQPIAALFDTWGGRGKLQDIFKKIDNPYKDAAIETAKLIEKGESSLAKDEIAMMKELLGDATTRKLLYDVSVSRKQGEGAANMPGSVPAYQRPGYINPTEKRVLDDVRRYGELSSKDAAKGSFYTTMKALSPILAKYRKKDLPVGIKGYVSPEIRALAVELGLDTDPSAGDSIELQRIGLRMLSDLGKMQSGTAISQSEFNRLKATLGSRLTPESYLAAINEMRDIAMRKEGSLIAGYHEGAQERIYGNPQFITDKTFKDITFKTKAEKEASGGGAVAPPKDLKEKKKALKEKLRNP